MFSLFALFHTGKTRLYTYYGSARPFPASDLISFSSISRLSSKGWKLELSFSKDLCSVLVFICFSFYILDFLLNFPFSHTDKLLCMSGHWQGSPCGTRGGRGHEETVSGRGQGEATAPQRSRELLKRHGICAVIHSSLHENSRCLQTTAVPHHVLPRQLIQHQTSVLHWQRLQPHAWL